MSATPLRVLHVLGELRHSGAEVMLAVAAPLFREQGVTADVLSTGSERVGRFGDRLAQAGYGVHHIPFARSPVFFWRLWKLLRTGYDVVHIHTERATFWVGLTVRAAGVPVMLKSIHNTFSFTGGLRLRRAVQRHVLAWLGLRQISVSPSVQDTEQRHFALETPVINNWFDLARFQPPSEPERRRARQSQQAGDEDVVLVSVGNCNAFKNHGELLRALALVPPGRRPLYLHAGEEEPGNPERELARTLGILGRVRFLGPVEDVRPLLHAADGFVMPSLREGLSISALEALATGLPAILGDVDGLRDFRPLFPGLIYCEPAAQPIFEAVRYFLDLDGESRRRLAQDYPSKAAREYDMRVGVEAYVRIYRGL